MPLIRCYTCNKKISPDAATCPKCGAPQQGEVAEKKKEQRRKSDETWNKIGIGCAIAVVLIIGGCLIAVFSTDPSPRRRPSLSEISTEEVAEDPKLLEDYTTEEILDEIDRIDRKHGW